MATTVTKTIGTGGDYSTLQAWEDACPANLVTADQIWRGECKNQEFVTTSTNVAIAGQTTDSTRYVWLTAASGASFMDNANKRTNALRYNSANGAAIRATDAYGVAVNISTANTKVSGLQIKNSSLHPTYGRALFCTAATVLDNLIVEGGASPVQTAGNTTLRNVLAIADGTTGNVFTHAGGGTGSYYNCTGVRPSNRTAAGSVFYFSYTTLVVKNCAGFGCTNFSNSTSFISGNNNASDATIGFGTSNQASLTYSSQFETTSSASSAHDFRTKAGASLIDNGADTSGNGVTTDIVGFSRSGTYDIGAWETGSSGISGTLTATLGAATLASTAKVAIAGTSTATLGAATLSSTGTVALAGTTTATLGAATLASTATVAIAGTSTATLAAATLFATGTLAISGTATATLAATTVVAAGTVAITGATSATLAAATLASTGTISISATLSSTLDAATLSASGTASSVNTGTLTATLAAATLSAASTLALRGTTNTTLANATLSSTGTLSLRASSSVTLAGVSLNATGVNGNIVRSVVLVWNGVRI